MRKLFQSSFLNKRKKKQIPPNNNWEIKSNGRLQEIEDALNGLFGSTSDLITENIHIGKKDGLLFYLNTLTNWQVITNKVLEPITDAAVNKKEINSEDSWKSFCKDIFSGSRTKFIQSHQDIIKNILDGHAIIFVDGQKTVLAIQVLKIDTRSVEEPSTQTVVRGPKEGFIEDVYTNLSLIRRRIRTPALRFEEFVIGKETATKVYIGYVDKITNPKFVSEVKKRLNDIDTNAIYDSANIEEFIEDKTISPFPVLYNTERPDSVSSHLLSGKVAIFVDGTPFVLTAPAVFNDFLSVGEDYYQPFLMGSFIRLIRYFSFLLALLLPSFYVGIITFHPEMIPTPLLISVISQREGIPFPAVIEALIMEITFEILREAGIRMPRAVGGTISIVGGLVIGQAAVEAGFVSNIMVIVVALTAISSFVAPVYSFAISTRLLRFVFIVLAAVFGLFGIFLGIIFMVAHLAGLRSFGVPYLAPYAPFILQDHGDTMIRFPVWTMKKRPSYMKTADPSKQPNATSPTPPPTKGGGK